MTEVQVFEGNGTPPEQKLGVDATLKDENLTFFINIHEAAKRSSERFIALLTKCQNESREKHDY